MADFTLEVELGTITNARKLFEADLRGLDLRKANPRGAYLSGANLREAHLGWANLSEAKLNGV